MEDFVPYELAVKLEQKGFKQGYNIFGYRPIFSDETTIKFISDIGAYENEYFGENIAAPTISQVLKWLRERRIDANAAWNNRDGKWVGYINEMDMPDLVGEYISTNTYDSYELAAIAAIESVIDNLI